MVFSVTCEYNSTLYRNSFIHSFSAKPPSLSPLYCGHASIFADWSITVLGCAVTDMKIGLRHVEHDVNNEPWIHSHEIRVSTKYNLQVM
jgi:hypothetical protein